MAKAVPGDIRRLLNDFGNLDLLAAILTACENPLSLVNCPRWRSDIDRQIENGLNEIQSHYTLAVRTRLENTINEIRDHNLDFAKKHYSHLILPREGETQKVDRSPFCHFHS